MKTILLLSFLLTLAACNQTPNNPTPTPTTTVNQPVASSGKTIAESKAGEVAVLLTNSQGHLKDGENDFTVEFRNAAGQPVDVGAVTMFIDMPGMGAMPPMKSNVKLMTTNTPGIYQATTNLEMTGTWYVNVSYKGNAGEGKTKFAINAK